MIYLTGIIVIAFGLDLILGDPRSRFHPVALLGAYANRVETLCRRLLGGTIMAGVFGWLLVVMPSALMAGLVTMLAGKYAGYAGGVAVAGIWLYLCIALRSLWQHAEAVRRPLKSGNLPLARHMLSMIVSRDTQNLDESEIARGAVESLGENLVDAVNSAVFWAVIGFLLGGAPLAAALAVLLRAANTLDACWGYKNERYLLFGRLAARADDVLHFIPARLSLLTIALAAPKRFVNTLKTGFKHRNDHPSPNSAWAMAAFAGALDIRLGGPTVYNGELERNPYLGNERAALNAADIRRAQRLAIVSALLFALLMLALAAVVIKIG